MNKLQSTAFNKFKQLKVGALFMEMGTGKTKVALELINYNIDNIDYVLWFTPCSTIDNLTEEINKWNYHFEVNIFGWETLSQSDRSYLRLLDDIENKKVFIVADESIFIKNDATKRYKRLLEVSKYSEYRLILNGTPLTKNEWDIYNQMYFLSPKIINMSAQIFENTFYKKVRYKKKGEKEKSFLKISEVNIDYLHKLIEPYVLKADFIFDKEVKEDVIYSPPTEETLTEYQEVKNNQLDNLYASDEVNLIALLQKLNHISSKDDNKTMNIKRYVDSLENKQVLIFCNFIEEVNKLSEVLDAYVITGDVKERNIIIDNFKSDTKPLIMTLGTGAFGLNLQFCNHIIFSSVSFDYGKLQQAKARIKRIGQDKDIQITFFDPDLPINKLIFKNLDKKELLLDLIVKELRKEDNA